MQVYIDITSILNVFVWDTRLPLGPTKDSLNSYDLFLLLKSSNYESQWKYKFILAWWRLYVSWKTASFPLWHLHWMKLIHFEIFVTACIEGCNLWRTYVYPILYLIYKPMCVHLCVWRGDDICIINFIKFSKCLKILWFNKKCSIYDKMVKKLNFCLTCYAKFADGRCIHYSRWRPTITWPCMKKISYVVIPRRHIPLVWNVLKLSLHSCFGISRGH